MIRTCYRDAVILHHRSADAQYRQSDQMPRNRSSRERSAFGKRMYEARKAAGLTQMQVRDALGCSQGTLSELEATAESSGLVARLADLYGVLPMWLATGEGPRSAPDDQQGAQATQVTALPAKPGTPQEPVSLAQALEKLGMALAAAPEETRPALASNMAGWCNAGGQGPWQGLVMSLLSGTESGKRTGTDG